MILCYGAIITRTRTPKLCDGSTLLLRGVIFLPCTVKNCPKSMCRRTEQAQMKEFVPDVIVGGERFAHEQRRQSDGTRHDEEGQRHRQPSISISSGVSSGENCRMAQKYAPFDLWIGSGIHSNNYNVRNIPNIKD